MKTKTRKAKVETSDVPTPELATATVEPVIEMHEIAVEAPEAMAELYEAVAAAPGPVVEAVVVPETVSPKGKKTVRGVMLKPVHVVYHAGLGTVHLMVKGGKTVGTKSLKVVKRKRVAPSEGMDGDVKVSEVQAVPEVATPA